jgi:3-dehydroquinate synthase
MNNVFVDLKENSYDVIIKKNSFSSLNKELKERNLYGNILIVVDKSVNKTHSTKIEKFVKSHKGKIEKLILDINESKKSFETLNKIYDKLIKKNFGRDSLLIAVGGGIIGDVCGYASATYSRGIQFVQVPTTLLAAVDSSVGGKTGINFGSVKNIVGAFYQPKLVLIDFNFFTSLKEREILCGLGEVIKYAFLSNNEFFLFVQANIKKLLKSSSAQINKAVYESVLFKAGVVASDEKESGLRKILNFGHTFAHAVEIEKKHQILHGEAVIIGMVAALYLSNEKGLLKESLLLTYLQLFDEVKDKIKIKGLDKKKIINAMKKDKKNRDGKIKFVLIKEIGNLILDVEADNKQINNALNNAIKFFKN